MQHQRTYASKVTPVRGKYRAQVWDPVGVHTPNGEPGYVSACKVLDLPPTMFDTKREAKAIVKRAEEIVNRRKDGRITIEDAFEKWHARPLDKEQSRATSAERVRPFMALHENKLLALVTDDDAIDYAEECPSSHIEGLRSFFTFCVGRGWIPESPFRPAVVKSKKGKGNRRKNPPAPPAVAKMIANAWEQSPSVGALLEFATCVGIRPGEAFGLRWGDLNRDMTEVRIERQWSEKTQDFTLPKNGIVRDVYVPEPAADALRRLRRMSLVGQIDPRAYVFTNRSGDHWRPPAFNNQWKAVKASVPELRGVERFTLYMCTRHYCGWYMVNVLDQQSEDVAYQLGHEDDGTLVRQLYGHRDRSIAQRKLADAWKQQDRRAA